MGEVIEHPLRHWYRKGAIAPPELSHEDRQRLAAIAAAEEDLRRRAFQRGLLAGYYGHQEPRAYKQPPVYSYPRGVLLGAQLRGSPGPVEWDRRRGALFTWPWARRGR